MIALALEPPFDDPQLFANPYLLSILSSELDKGFVIGAFGLVCSLPSAPAQHRHYDGGILFPSSGFDRLLPAAAVTVGIPLVEMNEFHGTTALWLGSHRDDAPVIKEPGVTPVVREGSCMLWDFRLFHGGTPNCSNVPRPLLYLTYCRPWFVDHLNFNTKTNPKQSPFLLVKNSCQVFFRTTSASIVKGTRELRLPWICQFEQSKIYVGARIISVRALDTRLRPHMTSCLFRRRKEPQVRHVLLIFQSPRLIIPDSTPCALKIRLSVSAAR